MNISGYKAVLFDWGNTVMVDEPGKHGKMKDWDTVQAVAGAAEVLKMLSSKTKCYLATGAAQSEKEDIYAALRRVTIDGYFTDIFTPRTTGFKKSQEGFYRAIIGVLGILPGDAVMIGDDMQNDIVVPGRCGIDTILFDPVNAYPGYSGNRIRSLSELLQ